MIHPKTHVQEILTSASKGAVDHNTGENTSNGLLNNRWFTVTLLLALVIFCIEVASKGFGERACEVTDNANVDRDVVFFGSGGQGEWMPLPVGHFWAREEDVLTSAGGGAFLLDLELHNLRRVLDNLGDAGPVTRANFTKDTFEDEDKSARQPVAL